jgi:hypothetical protein
VRSAIGRGSTFSLLIRMGLPTVAAEPAEPAQSGVIIHFVGDSGDLRACMELARNWRHAISHDATAGGPAPESRRPRIIVTLASLAARVRAADPTGAPIIALDDGHESPLPDDSRLLSLPVRPAKFRALLLGQLQNGVPRSIP